MLSWNPPLTPNHQDPPVAIEKDKKNNNPGQV